MIKIPILLFVMAIPFVIIGIVSAYRWLSQWMKTETRWIGLDDE